MPKLERVVLINSAGFDYLEFPVGGHSQVIGINGHGKSTLLRTILFFYLGTNDKAPYALHETKSDFVSHYLGDTPSYLVYEVSRGNGQPSFHIAATRPAGRIQFYFVDAPFSKTYYQDKNVIQSVDGVQSRLRESRCHFDIVNSYDEFNRRIYGIAASAYSVFKPAAKSSGLVSVLPRIISGIFTVSQLEADKLKVALTCGVKEHNLSTELDLLLLKSQLEKFSRVNRAVKTYLRYEDDALRLVDVAEEFEVAKSDRLRAIEDLVRMAKCMPAKAQELQAAQAVLDSERTATVTAFEAEHDAIQAVVTRLGKDGAVLEDKILQGERTLKKYQDLQIDRKAAELESLPGLREANQLAQSEYTALTAAYEDEGQRKAQMLSHVLQKWTERSRQLERKKAEAQRLLTVAVERLNDERRALVGPLEEERQRAKTSLTARRSGITYSRDKLTQEYQALASAREPAELQQARNDLEQKRSKARTESTRLQSLRSELPLLKERRERAREKLDLAAATEKAALESKVEAGKTRRAQIQNDLDTLDQSLARFFQSSMPETWPAAARALSREALFHDAIDLGAKVVDHGSNTAWGVDIQTGKLPEAASNYDREALAAQLDQLQKALAQDQDQLTALQQRYLAEVDQFEKKASQEAAAVQSQVESLEQANRARTTEITQIENRIVTLQSQFQTRQNEVAQKLKDRDEDLKGQEKQLRDDETKTETQFQSRKNLLEEDFVRRKTKLTIERDDHLAAIASEQNQAAEERKLEEARIESTFQRALAEKGVNPSLIAAAKARIDTTEHQIQRIEAYSREVVEYQRLKAEFIDPLDYLRAQVRTNKEALESENTRLAQLKNRHQEAISKLDARHTELRGHIQELEKDEAEVRRFRNDTRFLPEWGFFEREDLAPAPFYRAGAAREFADAASTSHQNRERIGGIGDKSARAFLNRFHPETLDKKVLGFSPIHEHFDWYIFVGSELRPFVNGRGILGMKQIQTQEFGEIIKKIRNKNADFAHGITDVRRTADLVQDHIAKNNFVDVIDSVELKVERVDNTLTHILTEIEGFTGVEFSGDGDMFMAKASRDQIDKAIDTFERLVKEIDNSREKKLRLTDYFEFLLRVHENGRDMKWRKSLDHIGSTGTDYLVKMLIYLSLIEVYRERTIDPKMDSAVHCILDETGVLAPVYVRSVLSYAKSKGIILITAGHSQQTVGFENWVRVKKRGNRFGGGSVLRKILVCD